jgi:hypothetical protein
MEFEKLLLLLNRAHTIRTRAFSKLIVLVFAVLGVGAGLGGCQHTKFVSRPSAPMFTDSDLRTYLKNHPDGMIYLVSAGMPLSVLGVEAYRKVATERGVAFLVLQDPQLPNASDDQPLLASNELLRRHRTWHFPATLLHKNGRLEDEFNPGLDTPLAISKRFDDFKAVKQWRFPDDRGPATLDHSEAREPSVYGLLRKLKLPYPPTYFIRVDMSRNLLFMSGRCVFSFATENCVSTSEVWEPFPVPSLGLLLLPHVDKKPGMSFFSLDHFVRTQVRKESAATALRFEDPDLPGFYQSAGVTSRTGETSTVRLVTYYGKRRDYLVAGDGIRPASEVSHFNPDEFNKFPMISKDGLRMSGAHWDQRISFVCRIKSDGRCVQEFSIPVIVGKMDWSYDNRFVAFHTASGGYLGIPERPLVRELDGTQRPVPQPIHPVHIHVMDVRSRKIFRLSEGPLQVYWPTFGDNGLLYALTYDGPGQDWSVLEIDPQIAMGDPLVRKIDCRSCRKQRLMEFFR